MRFQPKTEEQLQAESLLPVGTYDFRVTAAEDKISSAGNEMIAVTLAVYRPDGNGFYLVNDYLMEKMAYKLRHFCTEAGLMMEYEAGTLAAAGLIDREGKVQLVIDPERTDPATGKVYRPKNSVKDYGPGKDAKGPNATRPAQPVTVADDEESSGVPF